MCADARNPFGISGFHRQVHRIVSSNKEVGLWTELGGRSRWIHAEAWSRRGLEVMDRVGLTLERGLDMVMGCSPR
ncbi:hypothetical protein PIB30_021719 [Stylosanthes scabra]|uniref:Uncharacterized protein n=1 Tax=Stylosanthes scabra TaxID=79078 RepID=A0ABU6S8Z7_9FABA|nr:hypothetical protein [Stylosanthes scabra]